VWNPTLSATDPAPERPHAGESWAPGAAALRQGHVRPRASPQPGDAGSWSIGRLLHARAGEAVVLVV